jgi:hypothetical protein
MLELTGIELAIQMPRKCPECKVLLFSGQADTQCLRETALARENHFELISKPVHPTDLPRKIEAGFTQAS